MIITTCSYSVGLSCLLFQVVVLRVSIDCEGCKKVMIVVQNINGKFLFDIRIVCRIVSHTI